MNTGNLLDQLYKLKAVVNAQAQTIKAQDYEIRKVNETLALFNTKIAYLENAERIRHNKSV